MLDTSLAEDPGAPTVLLKRLESIADVPINNPRAQARGLSAAAGDH